ncbi:MAG: glutathione S-transferase [Candidatus Azotimanducaceae bacterium]|jgi:glutathione S-transferase
MEYLEPEQGRSLEGMRLVLTRDVPAPYSMSARAIFEHHKIPFHPIAQKGGGTNDELVAWTRHRNAPIALYNSEYPRTGWLDILNLAERLGSGSSLVPDDIDDRMTMMALTNELIGENGFIWQMRIVMLGLGGPERAAKEATRNPMYQDYGYSEEAKVTATERAQVILSKVTEQLERQYAANDTAFFIADHLTALDIYWVYFSQLLSTLPEDICATPSYLRKSYDASGAVLGGCDPLLISHRDRILENHLASPLTF